ncbi:hypothetical protein HIV01_013270 [Lysobacter arenosi]|uniref:Lipoprotein n=1 Tax=Lysobacter arenosi TaxID=2795387 RepID=A0ABX7R7W4_9GAMM|nr:hypothetical protein [Lysobacter arenosi]QSX74169.1 hypothetical protein HIV01_013270 [Lysobacter arenosi]
MPSIQRATAALLLVAAVAVAGCERAPAPAAAPTPTEPAQAVEQLIEDLRRNDFAAYARHSVPPALHARLDLAWNEGRTRWPLTELPLDDRLPAFISALAAPGAEKQLLTTYNRQFSGAGAELRSAASTLGLFATQYLRKEGDYSADERAHYAQLVAALSRWGQKAPLGDPQRARRTIPQLVAAARQTGLAGGPDTFRQLGMQRSLERFGPFFARFKQVLVTYGLDVDADLASARATLVERDGDRGRVRLDYTLAGQKIEAHLAVERHEGHWYLSDALRHAETQASAPAAPQPAAQPTR